MIIVAVVMALAVPALAADHHNQGEAQSQSAQFCMPQDDDFADTTTIYC
jgi:hypothetical protein